MKKYRNLTIFFVSYFSAVYIKKIVSKISPEIKVIIVDNANEKNIKKKFLKFKNVQIITSKYNKGQTGGINLGFKNIKTKYGLYMDSDIQFNKNVIDKFLNAASHIKNFIILAPQHERRFYINEFFSNKFNQFKQYQLMKIVHGQFLFFKMENVRKVGFYDEKIFLYFDETDYCLRAYRKNQNIYVLPKIKVKHLGGKSVSVRDPVELEANKHWHYMWSKFYFYKKNYSLSIAYKKTIMDLFKSFFKFIIFFLFNKRKKKIYINQFSGLINSYIGKTAYRRVKL